MNAGSLNLFLTSYIRSLHERTRREKGGVKLGFDWLIYQLASVRNWFPIRLPFYRRNAEEVVKPKTEEEYGIDMFFLLPSKKEVYIFVLKGEELTYRNWTRHAFDTDLRMACAPDLSCVDSGTLESVKVILAYNKDEDERGVTLFENFKASQPPKISGRFSLTIERWNLSRLVEEVTQDLLSPDLLPQHISEHFRYICSQIQRFDFEKDEWRDQLVNNWKLFLRILLTDADERKVRLVPVVLLIADNFRKNEPNSRVGWIDLVEWAMLALWDCCREMGDEQIEPIVLQIWMELYVFQLESYFVEIKDVIVTYHGFVTPSGGMGHQITPINDAYLTFWHLARLGILTLAPQEIEPKMGEYMHQAIPRAANWVASCIHLSPAALRPLLDMNHIELFLVWLILWQAGRENEIAEWLSALGQRLLMRRIHEKSVFPFIESNNRMDLLIEYAATGERPQDYSDSSSYLLLMLIELACVLPQDKRDPLIEQYVNRLVHGIGDDAKRFSDRQLDLMSWVPPDDWAKRILQESVQDGIAITTDSFRVRNREEGLIDAERIVDQIESLVHSTRNGFPWKLPMDIPQSVYILACVKNQSPLPPEFWRSLVFPHPSESGETED